MQGSDEWKQTKRRTLFVSGTTIQSICNEHPFRNADDVFNELVGTRPHFVGNIWSKMGQEMESVIVRKYEEMTGKIVDTNLPIQPMPGWPNVGVSPDGLVRETPILPIEIKYAPMRKIVKGTVPAYYSGQLQLTLAVFQVPMMHFVQMGSDGDIDIIPITRVEGYFDARIEKVTHFINRVESYRRENPDWEQAYLNWEAAGPTLPLTIKQ
jgi:hypothetical protein